jgi:putative salt-induced outer membrane protein YdiY
MRIATSPPRRGVCGFPMAVALAAVLAVLVGWPRPVAAAPKTDVVVLINGDRITGEIKGLEYNRLRFSTDHMGTIYIEWDKIARVQTDQYLLLERSDGVRYYGQLVDGAEDGRLQVYRGDDRSTPEDVAMASVVRAQPIEGGDLIDRLDGYVSAGFDFTKANNQSSFNFAGGLSSRTRVRQWSLDGSANVTDDSAGETSERYQLGGSWRQFRQGRDFYLGFGGLDRNSELDLNLRTLVGAGYGRYFVQSNRSEWVGGVGLAYSNENYTGGQKFNSLEAALTTAFSIFRYDFPETDIGGSLTVLPSLTKSGRYRAETDLRAKYEFVDDLYFELKFYGSYDSQPPSENTEKSDYGVVTSLGYSF